jgi:hypothetical protein
MKKETGQGFIEYVLIVLMVVTISILALKLSGVEVNDLFASLSDGLFGGGRSKLIVEDSFDDLGNWTPIFGGKVWRSVDGKLVNTGGGDKRVMLTTELPDDYVVSANGVLLKGDGYGVMFRLTPQGNNYGGYCFQLDPGYGNKFVLRKYVTNGAEVSKPIAVANPPAGFNFNASHDIQIEVVGNTYTAYIDGVQVMTATDNTYTSGGAGLRSWDFSSISVDNFSVSNP